MTSPGPPPPAGRGRVGRRSGRGRDDAGGLPWRSTCTTSCLPSRSARGRRGGRPATRPPPSWPPGAISAAFGRWPGIPDSPASSARVRGGGGQARRPGSRCCVTLIIRRSAAAGVQGAVPAARGLRLVLAGHLGAAGGSAPSTSSAASCPAAGRRGGGGALQIPKMLAGPSWPIRAGCSWWPTRPSSSPGCWPRSPVTGVRRGGRRE